jgi:hypothetical protein
MGIYTWMLAHQNICIAITTCTTLAGFTPVVLQISKFGLKASLYITIKSVLYSYRMSKFVGKKFFNEYLVSFKDMLLEFAEIKNPDEIDDVHIDVYSPTHVNVGITSIQPPSGNSIFGCDCSIMDINKIFDPEPHPEGFFLGTCDYSN